MILGPQLPPAALKTYTIRADPKVKPPRVLVSCEEYDCRWWRDGFEVRLDETTDQGQHLARIARSAGRAYVETRDGVLTVLRFGPGQECFESARHWMDTDVRPALYLVRGGTGVVNPRGTPTVRHSGAVSWVDDFGEHQQTLADRQKEG